MKKTVIIMSMVLVCLSLVSCKNDKGEGNDVKSLIIGTWYMQGGDSDTHYYTYKSDGSLVCKSVYKNETNYVNGSWAYYNERLMLSTDNGWRCSYYIVSITSSKMILTPLDYSETITWTKCD